MVNIDNIKNTIINANSSEFLKEIPNESIDMVITSPPYDNLRDYNNEAIWNFEVFKSIANQIQRVLKLAEFVFGLSAIKLKKDENLLPVLTQSARSLPPL